MKILVTHGANPLLLSNLNANILHAAAESKLDHGLAGALQIWNRCSDKLNINQVNRWLETPLHVASWCSAACVKLLIDAGADPGMQEENGQVPLHCAGLSEQGPDRREIVSLLCVTKDKSHINTQDYDGRPPIFDFLDDPECVELLIHHGADLSLTDKLGRSVYHHVCADDEVDALKTLLRSGHNSSEVTTKDYDGNTPLMQAFSSSNVNCAMVLLEMDDVGDIVSKDGWCPIHYAAKIGDVDLLSSVVNHPTFARGTKTMDGKGANVVAMEAGTWHGKVKEMIREHDFLNWVE